MQLSIWTSQSNATTCRYSRWELRDALLQWKNAACVLRYACYLDVRGMRVVVVGSAGAHCLCETQGRRSQGWFPLTQCSEEYLVAVKNKHQVSRLLLCNTNRQAWCGPNVIHSPSMGQFTYENSFWHQNPLEVHAHGEDTCVFKHLGLLTYFYVKLGPRRRVVGTHSVGKGLQWNLVWKSPVDCKTDLL